MQARRSVPFIALLAVGAVANNAIAQHVEFNQTIPVITQIGSDYSSSLEDDVEEVLEILYESDGDGDSFDNAICLDPGVSDTRIGFCPIVNSEGCYTGACQSVGLGDTIYVVDLILTCYGQIFLGGFSLCAYPCPSGRLLWVVAIEDYYGSALDDDVSLNRFAKYIAMGMNVIEGYPPENNVDSTDLMSIDAGYWDGTVYSDQVDFFTDVFRPSIGIDPNDTCECQLPVAQPLASLLPDGTCNGGGWTCDAGRCLPDPDEDHVYGAADNCPYFASGDTTNTDGDSRGDVCQCSDQTEDGRVTVEDQVAINAAIFNPSLVTPLCDGNNDGLCNVNDIIAANIEIFSPNESSTCARYPVPSGS